MGTHPSGPSKVAEDGKLLSDWLKENSSTVGVTAGGYPADDLPFLFKVLSVRTALSIQAHPDKALAQQLHTAHPDVYKDGNHKPEMVIALTDFECMYGFRDLSEIKENLSKFPEFQEVIQSQGSLEECLADPESAFKNLFEKYMACDDAFVGGKVAAMVARLEKEGSSRALSELEQLMLRLNSQYQSDTGVFSPLLMNYIKLKVGESFFIVANELHAYLSGDCIECMALSNNVVRAGLTPKLKDKATLSRMLQYKSGTPPLLQPIKINEQTILYRPPVQSCSEFEVEVTTLPQAPTERTTELQALPCASLLIVTAGGSATMTVEGKASNVSEGSVLFVAAGAKVAVSVPGASDDYVVYRAHANLGK